MTAVVPGTRWRRAARFAVAALAAGAGLVAAIAIAAALLADLPSSRRFVVHEVNRVLEPLFKGRLRIERIGSLRLDGVAGVDATVIAPDGTTVIEAHGLSGRVAPMAILLSFIRHRELRIDVLDASAHYVDVDLDTDPSGVLKLEAAFLPAHPSPESTVPHGLRVCVALPDTTTQHAHVHGHISRAPTLDADVDGLKGSVAVSPEEVAVDVARGQLTTRAMPGGANPRGNLSGHFALSLKSAPRPVAADVFFAGDVGGIPSTATGSLRGDRLDAVLDVPEVSPDKVRALVSQAPVYESIAVHVEAHGPLTAFPVTAHAALGSARVDAQGTIGLAPVLTASVAIDVRDLDLRALAPTAPPSALALHADVRADASADGRVSGTFALDVPAVGHVADQSIPVAAFQGHFRHEAGDADGEAILDGRVSEPGAPTMIHAEARIGPSAAVVQFAASSEIERLADVRRVGGLGPGQARVRIAGSVTLSGSPTLDAQVESSATGLRYAGVRLDRAKLAAHASGPLSSPTFTATLDVSRNGAALRAIVDQMRIADGRLDLLGISIAGLGGTAEGSLRVRPDGFRLHCDSKGIDVARLGYLLGMEGTLREGRVVFAADLSQAPNGAVGTIDLDARHVSIGPTDGASGHLAASIDGRTLAGSMIAAATGVGSVVAKTLGVTLAGTGPLSVESLRRAWGTIEMDGRVELASLRAWLPPGATPLGKYVSGTLALHGHVERAEAESLPNVTVTLKTSDLVLSSQSAAPGDAIASALRPRTAGFDVQIDATANGPTGHAALAMQLLDKEGPLASIVAKSDHVPYSRLLASKAAALAWMIRTPFSALLTVPSRSIAHWPDVFRPNLASGDVQGSVAIEGTCLEPRLKVALQAHSLQFGGSPFVELLDVEANATYQGAVADVAVDASALGRKLLHASGRLHTSAWDLIARGSETRSWDADAVMALEHFPLSSLGALADRQVSGKVSGRLTLIGLHHDARASADLEIEGLRVGQVPYGSGTATAGFEGHNLDARVRLAQADSFVSARLDASMRWGARLVPAADPQGLMQVSFQAKRFRAALIQPFVQAAFDELDGLIDADVKIAIPANKAAEMTGSIELRDGVVEPIALEQEFRAVNAKASFTADAVRLESLSSQSAGGKLTASGVVHLGGADVVAAEGRVNIAKGDAMNLEVQGSRLGNVYGTFELKATPSADRKTLALQLEVPSLHVELPDATPHSVQELVGPPKQVHVGVYLSPGRFVALPIDSDSAGVVAAKAPSRPLSVLVTLGRDVEIQRGTDLKVLLDGAVTATFGRATRANGQIRLVSGKLEVQGKSFEITAGTVTFVGDPANPIVKVTAEWTAAEGTRVFADYLGPLKTGRVTLRSEPARSQNEIVALILFGVADGSESTPYAGAQSDAAMKAGVTAGGLATGGLSSGIDKLTGLDITAKIDTSQAIARPEVAVQIARNISLELAIVLGIPPPGTNPDTTYATIDWRFLKSWSIETTVGNLGSAIADIVWRHMY